MTNRREKILNFFLLYYKSRKIKHPSQLCSNRALYGTQRTWERLKVQPLDKHLPGMASVSASRHKGSGPECFMRSLAAQMSNESINLVGT